MYENLELDLDLKLLFMALYGHIINLELNLDLKLLFMDLLGILRKGSIQRQLVTLALLQLGKLACVTRK